MNPRDARKSARPNRGRPTHARGRRAAQAPTRARLLALRVLERVRRAGAYADLALHSALARSSLGARDRAFATELVYGTLRWQGRLDFLLSQVLERDLEKLEPLVATTLRMGAYQLVFTDGVPNTAAVDESVRCARAAGLERATGLVNAVLRRLAAEHAEIALPSLDRDPLAHLTRALSLPEWIAERWLEQFGPEQAASLARASNEVPPQCVRVNALRTTPAELLDELRERFAEAAPCRLAPGGIVLGHQGSPARDPAFLGGRFTIQDEASQLVVELLDPQPGERVLDTCAAPGTKATAIAERVGEAGEVLALDRHARRLALVARDARRLGLTQIRTRELDATLPFDDLGDGGPFDRVLVDAPCSGLGALRRNPDARWRVQPELPAKLASVQRKLLWNASTALRPGGILVYSTCTLTSDENDGVVEAFLEDARHFRLSSREQAPAATRAVVGEDGLLRCLPHLHDTDGFFAARLERVA